MRPINAEKLTETLAEWASNENDNPVVAETIRKCIMTVNISPTLEPRLEIALVETEFGGFDCQGR